jgi:Glyoxalase-like domain
MQNMRLCTRDANAPVGMCFMPVTEPKRVKNRVHLDLTSSAQDRDEEIARLVALGGLSQNPVALRAPFSQLFENNSRAAPRQTWAMQAKDCGQLGEGLWQAVGNAVISGADLTSCADHSA